MFGIGWVAPPPDIWMILPYFLRRIPAPTAQQQAADRNRFVANVSIHSFVMYSPSANGPIGPYTPAQLTRIVGSSGRDTGDCVPLNSSRVGLCTTAPSFSKASAIARPNPLDAPVTMAV